MVLYYINIIAMLHVTQRVKTEIVFSIHNKINLNANVMMDMNLVMVATLVLVNTICLMGFVNNLLRINLVNVIL